MATWIGKGICVDFVGHYILASFGESYGQALYIQIYAAISKKVVS